jgi:hypothetical protein
MYSNKQISQKSNNPFLFSLLAILCSVCMVFVILFCFLELDVRHQVEKELSLEDVDLETDISALDDFLQDVDSVSANSIQDASPNPTETTILTDSTERLSD